MQYGVDTKNTAPRLSAKRSVPVTRDVIDIMLVDPAAVFLAGTRSIIKSFTNSTGTHLLPVGDADVPRYFSGSVVSVIALAGRYFEKVTRKELGENGGVCGRAGPMLYRTEHARHHHMGEGCVPCLCGKKCTGDFIMRAQLLAAAMAVAAPASPVHAAFDGKFDGTMVAKIYYDVRWNCHLGATADGKVLSASERDRQCRILDALGEQLKAHGYCWNNSKQEWIVCPARDQIN